MSIVAIEDCELLSMHHDDVEIFHKVLSAEETFSRYMSEIAYTTLYERIINREVKTVQERFEYFMKNTPYLLDKVPQYLSQLKKEYRC